MPIWTKDQQSAIDARNSNIIVSAAAGSGKTAVLVERVISLITDEINPVDIDKLLIVTFTNAAAAEMKSRIMKSLGEKLMQDANNSNIQRQLSLLPNAKISTIDSFCINLVRENFFKLNIQQDFELLDDSKNRLIEQDCVDSVIEKYYSDGDKDFDLLVELFSKSKDDKDFTDTIKTIYTYINAQAFPFDWLENVCEMYNPSIGIDDSESKQYAYSQIKSSVEYALKLIDYSLDSLSPDDELYGKYYDYVSNHKALFENMSSYLEKSWDEFYSYINSLSSPFSRMPSKRGYTSPSKNIISNNKDQYKKILEKDIMPFFVCNSEEYREDCEYLYGSVKKLISIVKDYHNEMIARKNELNSYSFSDIEHFAINLLFYLDENKIIVTTDLANELKDSFYEILVDEYQDTNSAQDKLFEIISNGFNRFMVGDVKQSIYRFRHAMPSIFNHKKDEYTPYVKESNNQSQRIILDKNFRSRQGICEFTNFVFSKIMTKKVGELDYNAFEYLNYGADYKESDLPCVSLKLINTPDGKDNDEYEARQCAELILSKIKSGEKIKDGDSYRNITFKDFAILFRSTANRLPIYNKVLTEYGIPVISNNKINLFENNEVSILVSLLRVIDNPIQDIPLLAALMSVFYGYSADDIAAAKVNYPSRNLYSSIVKDEKFTRFINDLEKYRKYASSMSVEAFIRQLINETSFLSLISAMGNFAQRKQNVMKLLDLAHSFDKGENVGLTAFMRYVDSIIRSGVNMDSATVSTPNSNCVTLTTIHKSKGLEYPITILAGSAHKYNTTELFDQVQLNAEKGIGLKVHMKDEMYRYNSLQYNCIKDANKSASMSENLRVLYVAITRAREQFIMLYTGKNIDNKINKLLSKIIDGSIPSNVVKDTYCDGDLILMCSLLHKDAKVLRDYCEDYVLTDPFATFKMSVDVLSNVEENISESAQLADVDENLLNEISDKLDFKYDRRELSSFISKRTASSLDEKEQGFKYFAKSKPAFLSNGELTAAQKGTAMHAFMQYCDYENAKNNLIAEIERLKDNNYLSDEQANALNTTKLSNLFNSEFAKRMFESDKIYREIKVSSFIPVNELEDTELTDNVLVQGIADCVFEENGELVLVDYKTDRVDNENELLDLYKNQIAFYKKAIEKTLKKPVKTALLYSFSLDKICIYK